MYNRFKRVATLVVLLAIIAGTLVVGQGTASAQAPSQSSTFQVLNLSSSVDASITIDFYNQQGTKVNSENDTVARGASNTYNPIPVTAPFNGSAVISSSEPVAVISNLVINTTKNALGSYVGFNAGGSTLYFPLIQKGNGPNNSTFNIQNTGDTQVSITIKFVPEPGQGYPAIADVTDTIQPGAAKTYDQATMSQFSSATKWVGSATVTVNGSGTVAGVANVINSADANAYRLFTYNGFTAGTTTVKAPLIQEANNTNRTSINCQNLSPNTTTTINVQYTPEPGNPAKASESKSNIGPNAIAVFLQAETGTKFVGSALISSSPAVPLACVINQTRTNRGLGSAYEGFSAQSGAASNTVVAPLVQAKNGATNVYSAVTVATLDGTEATFTIDYRPEPGITDPPNETKTGAVVVFDQNASIAQKFVGGAVITANKPIVAIVNQTRGVVQYPRDVLSSYSAFNQ